MQRNRTGKVSFGFKRKIWQKEPKISPKHQNPKKPFAYLRKMI